MATPGSLVLRLVLGLLAIILLGWHLAVWSASASVGPVIFWLTVSLLTGLGVLIGCRHPSNSVLSIVPGMVLLPGLLSLFSLPHWAVVELPLAGLFLLSLGLLLRWYIDQSVHSCSLHDFSLLTILALLFATIGSTVVAISFNLEASLSSTSGRGILFNMFHCLESNAFDDIGNPLRQLFYILNASFCALVILVQQVNHLPTSDRLRLFTLGSAGLVVASTFAEHFGLLSYRGRFDHAHGLMPDPHSFGSVALVFMALVAFPAGSAGYSMRTARILALALAFVSMILAESKYSMVAAVFIILVFGWKELKRVLPTQAKIVFMGLFILTLYVFMFTRLTPLGERLFSFYHSDSIDFDILLSNRASIYLEALSTWASFPLTGIGIGNFFWHSQLPSSESLYLRSVGGENAHSFPLQVLSEGGLVSAMPWLVLLILPIILYGLDKKTYNPMCLVCLTLFLGGNIFAHSLLEPHVLAVYFMSFASAVRSSGLDSQRFRCHANRAVFYFPLALSVFWLGLLPGMEDRLRGTKCVGNSWSDGQIGNNTTIQLNASNGGLIRLRSHHDHVDIRPVRLDITMTDRVKNIIYTRQLDISDNETFDVKFPPDALFSKFVVSRCFVPSNLGISSDSRKMALQLISSGYK